MGVYASYANRGGFVECTRNKDIDFLSQFQLMIYGKDYAYTNGLK